MPVSLLRRYVDAEEFARWRAFDALYGLPDAQADLNATVGRYYTALANFKTPGKLSTHALERTPPEGMRIKRSEGDRHGRQTLAEMQAVLSQAASAAGAAFVKKEAKRGDRS